MNADPERRPPAGRRLPVLGAIALSLLAAGLVDLGVSAHQAAAPVALSTVGAPVGAESSDWYCTGGTGTASGAANATLYLVNAGARTVVGTLTVAASTGASSSEAISVPPGQTTAVPSTVVQGPWLASRVDLEGGGVTVDELVHGAAGWAEAPCASTTSTSWYFASGSTANGSLLYVSVYNPASTMAVVDLTFYTTSGVIRPDLFQGLVLAPGAVVVAEVASYVQGQSSVSTVVEARAGRVVADELEEHAVDGVSGLSLELGSPSPERRWLVPRTVNVTGGRDETVVFNPTGVAEQVTAAVRLPSGPVTPEVRQLAPGATWTLVTSGLIRIPPNTDYATTVTASGPGVVVDRVVRSSSAGTPPQWGAVAATPSAWTTVASGRWALANPAVPTTPVGGAAPFALDLLNPGGHEVTVTVRLLTRSGPSRLGRMGGLRIPPGALTVVEPAALAAAGGRPLVVSSSGPLAATLDATPAGMPGVVALAAIPLAG